MNIEKHFIQLEVELIKDGKYFCLSTKDNDTFSFPIITQGETIEEAEKHFWTIVKVGSKYNNERAKELDLWKPFQKGDWDTIGGTWFTIFGIHVSFRYGKGVHGGWYIPFTKLNISIFNYWRRKKG